MAQSGQPERKKNETLKLTDGLIRTSGLEQNMLAMWIERRTYKYLATATNCDSAEA